jgi:hypothetical protein
MLHIRLNVAILIQLFRVRGRLHERFDVRFTCRCNFMSDTELILFKRTILFHVRFHVRTTVGGTPDTIAQLKLDTKLHITEISHDSCRK